MLCRAWVLRPKALRIQFTINLYTTMATKPTADVNAMRTAYQNTAFSVSRLQQNFQEATFTKTELLDFLNGLTARNVKITLGLLPETNHVTVVLLGANAQGAVQLGGSACYSDIPCPPNCRTVPARPKIIIST